jgi:stress-induced-phosphoprotein 1
MSQAEEYKKLGNAAFSAGKFKEAAEFFSQAISIDPKNHILYSNRSACFTSLKQFGEALKDAETTIQLNSSWAKVPSVDR